MPRAAYIVEVQPGQIASLAFAAGILVAQGVAQGQVIADMLDNVQMIEVPDELFPMAEAEVIDFPQVVAFEADTPEVDLDVPVHGEVPPAPPSEADPEEIARILAETPVPESTPVYMPFSREGDFGAGPGPRS